MKVTSLIQQSKLAAKRFYNDEEGATAVEYALLITFIGILLIGGATYLGYGLGNFFVGVTGRLNAG